MGDTGKKDKDKRRKQELAKKEQKAKEKHNKMHPPAMQTLGSKKR